MNSLKTNVESSISCLCRRRWHDQVQKNWDRQNGRLRNFLLVNLVAEMGRLPTVTIDLAPLKLLTGALFALGRELLPTVVDPEETLQDSICDLS